MVTLMSLWLPILLSAVFVFVASSIIHMVLKYHRADFAPLPRESDVMAALRPFAIPPGDYVVPCPTGPGGMKDPAYLDKLKNGPVAILTVMPNGTFNMGTSLIQWFVYCVVVSVIAAYVTGRTLGPGTHYLPVFRVAGTVSFIGYGLALWQNSIWYKKKWSTTLRSNLDGLIYGCLTAGTFGWLWPR
jgi:hypothetical protein